MKKSIIAFALLFTSLSGVSAQSKIGDYLFKDSKSNSLNYFQKNQATITFQNKSDYTLTLKILNAIERGLYSTITLSPHSSRTVGFTKTAVYKLKIKATHLGTVSYHDGGTFSVTCTDTEWSEGTMSFEMSSYGNGLGPSISAKEFESNY